MALGAIQHLGDGDADPSANATYGQLYSRDGNPTWRQTSGAGGSVLNLGAGAALADHGQLSVTNGAGSQTIGTSYTKINQFTSDLSEGTVTADHTTDDFTLGVDGEYLLQASISFSGSANATFTIEVQVNGAAVPAPQRCKRKLGTGGDVGCVALTAYCDALSAADVVSIAVKANVAGRTFVVEEAVAFLVRIG